MDQLPCRCREVYRLSQQQDLNNKTIASALLISEKTVEYHLYKAISFIRTNLEPFYVQSKNNLSDYKNLAFLPLFF
ncbi:sigma factor-like helix-turn-helix DNA-binding protein [Pedobacter steynii]